LALLSNYLGDNEIVPETYITDMSGMHDC